jgi:hypothetical protein
MRAELLQWISAGHTAAAFRTPKVLEICQVGGRVAVIEGRLVGITPADVLRTTQNRSRDRLLCSYRDAAASIGDIEIHMPPPHLLNYENGIEQEGTSKAQFALVESTGLPLPSETVAGVNQ